MTHRSGYSYYGNPQFFTSTIKYDNLDDFVTDVSKHPVEFEPGSSYLYGINQAILGKVVEVVTFSFCLFRNFNVNKPPIQ